MTEEYITFKEYTYLMNRIAYWILTHNDLNQIKFRNIYGYFRQVVDQQTLIDYIRKKGNTLYMEDHLVAEFVECLIVDNKNLSILPAYVTGSDGTKYYTNTFVSFANRVSAYEVLKGKSPAIVYIKDENKTSTSTPTLDYFESKFGKCEYIDDAMAKIQGRGYAYYYNSAYNTNTTINRIANRQGVNCTDSAQLFYRLAYDMNNKYGRKYEVQFVHVFCQSGTGHIRLRLRSNGGNWFYRDPSACLDGNGVTYNWCSNGSVNAYNPSWIFSDLYQ
jgi:hypothetical protein